MKMNELPAAAGAAPEVFQQLGALTRQLHDALNGLGVLPTLQQSTRSLPDARSRLAYVALKTGEAADKVLTAVEQAKLERAGICDAARRMTAVIAAQACLPGGAVIARHVGEVEAAATRIDAHLTDIMIAQDFHDLTGQMVATVVALAIDLEDNLVKLLLRAASVEQAGKADAGRDSSPVVGATGRVDVVANQNEVDDLLASLGF